MLNFITFPQKLEIIRIPEKWQKLKVMPSHNIGSSTTYDKQKGQLQSFMTSSGSVQDLFK
jgi:hypothetical protein